MIFLYLKEKSNSLYKFVILYNEFINLLQSIVFENFMMSLENFKGDYC